ncbi:MAG: HEPN domain-containing protein [Cyanobacteriota bacterium]|nr:HEPN domain-containing protein [Cyanobacteriota bacterium]
MAPADTPTAFLRIARRDLATAMAMVDSSVFEEDAWGFYLQQATEKGLKAWLLILAHEQPPFTHNLRLMYQRRLDRCVAVQPFVDLSRFTFFAVLRRYDEEPEPQHLNRPAWNQLCADLLAHVASQIP